jgi:DNA-binding response OmpR family regulator
MTQAAASILAVDDSQDFRTLYYLWFGSDHEIRTATNGVEALERIDSDIDVVLLDREMPRNDGIETARELRRRGYDVPIIMISGVKPDTDLLTIPVDDYLQKPVQRDEVVAAMRCVQNRLEYQTRYRRLLALDTRLRIVSVTVGTQALSEKVAYGEIKAAVEHGRETLEQSVDQADISPDTDQSPRVATPDT